MGDPLVRRRIAAGLVAVSALFIARPAAAQDRPRLELSGGYLNAEKYRHGWFVQVARPISSNWSLVAEVDRAEGNEAGDADPADREASLTVGLRQSWQPTPRLSPFWHLTGGAFSWTRSSSFGVSSTHRDVAIRAGGGMTVRVTARLGVQAMYEVLSGNGPESVAMYRAALGGVIRIGG